MYRKYIKRSIDLLFSLLALLCIMPIIIFTIILLYFSNKGSGVFFIQERPGKDERIFRIIKFKTMTDKRDEKGNLLPDSQRLTKIGKIVRLLSIDELPQLFNVIKGDMALIGPRPLVPEYLWVLDEKQKRRHEVRPGISGWAQVHGRNHCKLSKKFEMDVWYVEHCSFTTDLKIFWLTIKNVIKCSDVGEGGSDMESIDDLGMEERILSFQKNKKDIS